MLRLDCSIFSYCLFFFFNDTATTEIYTLSLHDALPICSRLRSVLDDIEGIGPVRRRALLRHFGSLKKIRSASAEEIAVVKGMNRELAAEVRRYLDTMGAMLEEQERAEAAEEAAALAAAGSAPDSAQLDLALASA